VLKRATPLYILAIASVARLAALRRRKRRAARDPAALELGETRLDAAAAEDSAAPEPWEASPGVLGGVLVIVAGPPPSFLLPARLRSRALPPAPARSRPLPRAAARRRWRGAEVRASARARRLCTTPGRA
jgi:hypothetical protein